MGARYKDGLLYSFSHSYYPLFESNGLLHLPFKNSDFWDIMPCSPLKVNRRFRRKYYLQFQRRKTSQARLQYETGSKSYFCSVIHVFAHLKVRRYHRAFSLRNKFSELNIDTWNQLPGAALNPVDWLADPQNALHISMMKLFSFRENCRKNRNTRRRRMNLIVSLESHL
jgi:hypothetical protein